MTLLVLALIAGWCAVSFPISVLVGRVIAARVRHRRSRDAYDLTA